MRYNIYTLIHHPIFLTIDYSNRLILVIRYCIWNMYVMLLPSVYRGEYYCIVLHGVVISLFILQKSNDSDTRTHSKIKHQIYPNPHDEHEHPCLSRAE